jgi:hypothetical protein
MWFMSRDLFLSIGGYDERFAGWYGSDRDFRSRLRNKARVVRLHQRLIRVTPDAIADASTSQYDRLTPADSEAR